MADPQLDGVPASVVRLGVVAPREGFYCQEFVCAGPEGIEESIPYVASARTDIQILSTQNGDAAIRVDGATTFGGE